MPAFWDCGSAYHVWVVGAVVQLWRPTDYTVSYLPIMSACLVALQAQNMCGDTGNVALPCPCNVHM